jgi:hypothetical protein
MGGVMMAAQCVWRISGEQVNSCNCAWGCPCQFNSRPTHGKCHGAVGWRIAEGYYSETRLDGLSYALVVSWPGALHEGNGIAQWFIDERANPAQRAALSSIVSGQTGGALFQVLASICPKQRPVLTARIEIESDRERRIATLRVGDYASTRLGSIINPVTHEEHRARIVLPNGFEYKEAEMANTLSARVNAGAEPLVFELENSYGQLNAFEYVSS